MYCSVAHDPTVGKGFNLLVITIVDYAVSCSFTHVYIKGGAKWRLA